MDYRRILTLIAPCLVVLASHGCASKIHKHSLLSTEGQGPSAEVYIFRDESLIGGGLAVPVYLQGESLLRLERATYTKVFLKPGTYELQVGESVRGSALFSLSSYGPAFRSMTFEAGKTYFIHLKRESNPTLGGIGI